MSRDKSLMVYAGEKFSSATAFSIHCKRQQTPNKQGDDGWKSVLYEGQPLDTFRRRLPGPGASAQPGMAATDQVFCT